MKNRWKIMLLVGMAAMVMIAVQPQRLMAVDDDRGTTPSERPVIGADQFELAIATDKAEYTIGERPVFTATLTNNSDETVTLVRSLDGSDMGRYPLFQWTVTAPPNASPLQQFGRCGNTNPIMPGDFVSLAPGANVVLTKSWGGGPWNELERGPGEYAIEALYSTDEVDMNRWVGGPMAEKDLRVKLREVAPRLSRVPRITVKSNVVHVRFVSK